jgi:hypothetical protein
MLALSMFWNFNPKELVWDNLLVGVGDLFEKK